MTAQLHFTAIFFADPDGTGSWQAGGPEDAPTNADEFVFDDGTDQWREPTDEEREIAVDASVGLAALLHPIIDLTDPQVRADIIEALDRAGEDLAYARDGGNYEDPDIAGVNAQIDRWSKLWKRLVTPVG
jgi:hypothetical protein